MTSATDRLAADTHDWQSHLPLLRFRAETNPLGPAIDLSWELPFPVPAARFPNPDTLPLAILRRQRRFPGKNRRGVIPIAADRLDDGLPVYNTATFGFDFEETESAESGNRLITITRQYRYQGYPRDRALIRSIRQESELPVSGGDPIPTRMTVRFIDRQALQPGTIYYYTAFVGDERIFSRLTQASALATGRYGHALFTALPQIHQRLDTTPPPPFRVSQADQRKGQLQRFLEVFDAHADMFQGLIAGLRDLHNPRRVDSRLLPHLAHLVNWRLRDYLDEDGQRNEVLFAPEVYRTIGTIPNIAAIINRLTGWDARIREFAHNVLLSFDTGRLERMPSGDLFYLDGSLAANPSPPPPLQGRRLPPGSINTADATAMFKLRTKAFDEQTAYSYDCGQPDGQGGYLRHDHVLYNRETIGIYITPDIDTEIFSLQEQAQRLYQVLSEFLLTQVQVVLFLQPVEVEEEYDATRLVQEASTDQGILVQEEIYGEGLDESLDRIPEWQRLVTNNLNHRTVNTAVSPVNTNSRTWHTGLAQER